MVVMVDETEQDIMIIQTEFSRSEAEACNTGRGLNNSDILRKPNSIIPLLFFLQQKQSSQQTAEAIVKKKTLFKRL